MQNCQPFGPGDPKNRSGDTHWNKQNVCVESITLQVHECRWSADKKRQREP